MRNLWTIQKMVRVVIITALVACIIQNSSLAEVTKLSPADRNRLENVTQFREIFTTNALPPDIVVLCTGTNGGMANPGQKWQETYLITDRSLPWRRLIWAAVSSHYYVVHYESGGIAHSYHILVATFSPGDTNAKLIWHGVADDPLNDYPAFLNALRDGKLDDRLNYFP